VNKINHKDRLFPVDPGLRRLAKKFYDSIKDLPIISPHGHTDPIWFDKNENFTDATTLFVTTDHYVFRMLYSQGLTLEELGVKNTDLSEQEKRKIWQQFAAHFYLFRGTPTSLWLNQVFSEVFGLNEELNEKNADHFYNMIGEKLKTAEFKPRALFKRFNIEVISTTDDAIDDLQSHKNIKKNWDGRVLPTFRPDRATDPEHEDFHKNLEILSSTSVDSYLNALKDRRQYFIKHGATATDHGPPRAFTYRASKTELQILLDKALRKNLTPEEAHRFRGAMLVEMAKMSLDDGLVMQIHPGSFRNHNEKLFSKYGRDVGADIPTSTDYVHDLKALLNEFGNEPKFRLILFTLDESRYASELAPLAGHYPALKLGPAWWFHDSPEGMLRFRRSTSETAGFYNTVGFNDDTRAFFSIPARHDLARRVDCHFFAELVGQHRISEEGALKTLQDLTYKIPKESYRL
jgi:glucuronate isomerase